MVLLANRAYLYGVIATKRKEISRVFFLPLVRFCLNFFCNKNSCTSSFVNGGQDILRFSS